MLRTTRSLAVLVTLILLAGCGNKGDLLKPSTQPADKTAAAVQG